MVALTHWVCFLFFLRELLMLRPPPRLSEVFLLLVRLSSFPACWRQANVTQIPKGPPFFSVANYRPISITSVLSKVFESLVSVRLGRFMERSGVLPTTQFAIHCRVQWRVDRRLGSSRLTSVQLLIGSTIYAFSISSAMLVLEVLSCLY